MPRKGKRKAPSSATKVTETSKKRKISGKSSKETQNQKNSKTSNSSKPINDNLLQKVDTLQQCVNGLTGIVKTLTNQVSQINPCQKLSQVTVDAQSGTETLPTNSLTVQNQETNDNVHGDSQVLSEIVTTNSRVDNGESENIINTVLFNTSNSRPVMLASGVPAGGNIPLRIKQKIWTDKYIDFHDILHPETQNTYYMSLSGQNDTPQLNFQPKRKRSLSETEWSAAWDDYMAVYTTKYPSQLNDMITYSKTIKDFMRLGYNWQHYDIMFRTDREYTKCSWAALRVDLQISISTQRSFRPPLSKNTDKSVNNYSNNQTPPGYCFKYHDKYSKCTSPSCPYKHFCPRCGAKHPLYWLCKSTPNTNYSSKKDKQDKHSTRQGNKILEQSTPNSITSTTASTNANSSQNK